MDHYVEVSEWIEVFQAFFDVYNRFRKKGEKYHKLKIGFRKIEINILDEGTYLFIDMVCPDILKGIDVWLNKSFPEIEEVVRKIYWLIYEAEEPYTYEICEGSYEEEYEQIREILVNTITHCDENMNEEILNNVITERIFIECHGRQVEVSCQMDRWGEISVCIYDKDVEESFWTATYPDEDDPYELICAVHAMLLEPRCIKFSMTDSRWEHELIRNALIVIPKKNGSFIERYPFCWMYNWDEANEKGCCFIIHNREIRMQFIPHKNNMYINIICVTTGKSYITVLPAQCKETDEIGEEVVWRIQELAWS